MTTRRDVAPWQRQPGESSRAYKAFCVYRDLGANRSLAEVAKVLGRRPSGMGWLSRKWHWVERARAWDSELARVATEIAAEEAAKMARRHAKAGLLLQFRGVEKLAELSPVELTAADAVRMVEAGVRIEQIARSVVPGGKAGEGPEARPEDSELGRRLVARVLSDPATTDLALTLFERVTVVDEVPEGEGWQPGRSLGSAMPPGLSAPGAS